MITVKSNVLRQQKNFWNGCVFHPTDAVEDSWGKRILDRMAQDKAMKMIRIYTMFEDIVYLDESGNLQYDFQVNDLRLDYLVEKGFDIMLAYATVPDCISSKAKCACAADSGAEAGHFAKRGLRLSAAKAGKPYLYGNQV